ncbi:GtrA family protein [Dictyobacter formicarum]|uniref:GtrA/DPMS transmembrane domain-containing protein n=1 Tax=Dictyobacter formicarum TaxID=2778368 RepID=A0ABQ3VK96_9CHLR|nr:GtrA family protein [Dictyobacter formicarum]GHO86612.1 hypothetical protein KSZ_46180 [Dictyobacter formicarum]
MVQLSGSLKQSIQYFNKILFSRAARPLRFVCTGGLAAIIQLGLLNTLIAKGWESATANVVSFLLSAQVNFLMSFFFTWRDRQPASDAQAMHVLFSRWLKFHSSIVFTALLNQIVFIAARSFIPALLASALGIGVASLVNFFTMNTLVFRPKMTSVQLLYPTEMKKPEMKVMNDRQPEEENV